MADFNKWVMGCLSKSEYLELLSLEYCLMYGYSDNIDLDEKRYKFLTNILWESRMLIRR